MFPQNGEGREKFERLSFQVNWTLGNAAVQRCKVAGKCHSLFHGWLHGRHVSATMAVFRVAKADRGVYSLVIRP